MARGQTEDVYFKTRQVQDRFGGGSYMFNERRLKGAPRLIGGSSAFLSLDEIEARKARQAGEVQQ
jgi:hypothetical protein